MFVLFVTFLIYAFSSGSGDSVYFFAGTLAGLWIKIYSPNPNPDYDFYSLILSPTSTVTITENQKTHATSLNLELVYTKKNWSLESLEFVIC
jgi:hypothetical protein